MISFIHLFIINALKEIFLSQGNTDEDTLTCNEESCDKQLYHNGNEATPSPESEQVPTLIFFKNKLNSNRLNYFSMEIIY